MEKQIYTAGERLDKFCAVCKEDRGHVVVSVTRGGHGARVSCPKCGTASTFKNNKSTARTSAQSDQPYDPARTYRAGQTILHKTYGPGEVTSVIEPQKIDVLFADRLRRLIHSRAEASLSETSLL